MEKHNVNRTAGIDLGDRWSHLCIVDEAGEVEMEARLRTSEEGVKEALGGRERMRVVLEAGTHSPWLARQIGELGHEVIVANPRRVELIARGWQKHDQSDAETLARLGRVDVRLLHPVLHRSQADQEALAVIRARRELVEAHTGLINHVRGATKSLGMRLPACDTRYFARTVEPLLDGRKRVAQQGLLTVVRQIEEAIQGYDQEVRRLIREEYPQAELLEQVPGVGPLTALTYVLVIGDPTRFRRSRDVAAYLGLVPARRQSGERDPQLGITKQGDVYLRSLLVESANYIMSNRSRQTDLKSWGQARWSEADRSRNRKTKVAIARKLAVLLHRLWVTAEVYELQRQGQASA